MAEVHDLVRWANAADIQGTRQIGAHAIVRVLVGLACHADRDGGTFVSAQRLADEITNLSRRDVRNALDVLEAGGHIERTGHRGRTTTYRLAFVESAGHPANAQPPRTDDPAGYPANASAGPSAGESAGHPATKPQSTGPRGG